MRHVVIVGASAAGVSCAEELRRGGFSERITIIGDEGHPPYDRPPLSKQFAAGAWDAGRCALRQESQLEKLGLEWHPGVAATALDRQGKTLVLADGREIGYDGLVIATGVSARRLSGYEPSDRIHYLRRLEDAARLRDAMSSAATVAVVGAGVLGSEIAATARGLGLQVTLIDPMPVPMLRQVGPALGAKLAELHAAKGVEVRTGNGVTRMEENGACLLTLSNGSAVKADVVLIAVGSVPNTGWLASSGLDLSDGVSCDEYLRAGPDGIVAAGDVASWQHLGLGRRVRVEHRTNASEQGQAAARTLLGERSPFCPIPFFWTDQYDVRIQVLGLPTATAELDVVSGSLGDDRFAGLYYDADVPVAAVTWNMPRETRRLRLALCGQ